MSHRYYVITLFRIWRFSQNMAGKSVEGNYHLNKSSCAKDLDTTYAGSVDLCISFTQLNPVGWTSTKMMKLTRVASSSAGSRNPWLREQHIWKTYGFGDNVHHATHALISSLTFSLEKDIAFGNNILSTTSSVSETSCEQK